jgi:diguanylate cyclase (GGDEF)-like protein
MGTQMGSGKQPFHILVVDDDESLRTVVSQVLTEDGHEVTTAGSGEAALEVFQHVNPALVITDILMDGLSGIDLLKEIKQLSPETQVIIMTSHLTVDSAISAIRAGAYDYLVKPFDDIGLVSTSAGRALDKVRLIEENRTLVQQLKYKNEKLAEANMLLKELSIRDGLTGLHNHRHFQEKLVLEVLRTQRSKGAFSLIFLDLDFFKHYNDTRGHPAGDNILIMLSDFLKNSVRVTDLVARYGGEEFVILLPETPKEKALSIAETIRQKVADHPFPGKEIQPLGMITISAGVAAFPEDGDDGSALIQCADQALYRAKKSGKNKVC